LESTLIFVVVVPSGGIRLVKLLLATVVVGSLNASADIKAEMKDGLLRVTLPKVTQQPEQPKIAIA